MAVNISAAFANGVSACYDPSQIQALLDAYCNPCIAEGGAAGGCFRLLPTGTPVDDFPTLGWGNIQPDPAVCPFLGVVVDCTLWLAPNDPSCNFLDPLIWVKIGGFIAAPKAQFSYQAITPLPMTGDNVWFQLPLGVSEFNTMTDRLTPIGNTIRLAPGNYIIRSSCSFNVSQNGTELFFRTRLFNVTNGVQVKQSNFGRISGLGGAAGPTNRVNHTVSNYLTARVTPTVTTIYEMQHSTSGGDAGDFKNIAENNELYIERDN